jgi:pantoate--beta-alanine ligase
MQIIQKIQQLKIQLDEYRKASKTIGFVPTMGALHEGHLSLVSESKKNTQITVVSVFVNPTQFNDKADLERYPHTPVEDLDKLGCCGVDIVFMPSSEEMYPETDTRIFDFGNLDKVLEGEHRPGHFNGVAQIVSKFFAIVEPDKAYFGEKDFQQLTIIRQLVKKLNFSVQIIGCPIIREVDGLAMSSRNVLLSPVQRNNAANISRILFESMQMAKNNSVETLRNWVIRSINENADLITEYFEIVDDLNLLPISSWDEPCKKVGCIAVKVGKIRLIDNIRYIL